MHFFVLLTVIVSGGDLRGTSDMSKTFVESEEEEEEEEERPL